MGDGAVAPIKKEVAPIPKEDVAVVQVVVVQRGRNAVGCQAAAHLSDAGDEILQSPHFGRSDDLWSAQRQPVSIGQYRLVQLRQ